MDLLPSVGGTLPPSQRRGNPRRAGDWCAIHLRIRCRKFKRLRVTLHARTSGFLPPRPGTRFASTGDMRSGDEHP